MLSFAVFSSCERYRYVLHRRWAPGPACMFLMLNPSTATEQAFDPTVRRCFGYARDWGYGALYVGNLFAFRSTDPAPLKEMVQRSVNALDFAIGPDTDAWLRWMSEQSALVVCGWGGFSWAAFRGEYLWRFLRRPLTCLKVTKFGAPNHPLYLPKDLAPTPWPKTEAEC